MNGYRLAYILMRGIGEVIRWAINGLLLVLFAVIAWSAWQRSQLVDLGIGLALALALVLPFFGMFYLYEWVKRKANATRTREDRSDGGA